MKKAILILAAFFTYACCRAQHKPLIPFKKGDLRLALKLPHFNYLSLNPKRSFRDNKFGFNGYGVGIEYSYKENKFVETSVSFIMTFELPFPAPIDKEHNKALFCYFISATDNFKLKRFSFGYGVNYSVNCWREWTRNLSAIGLPATSQTFYANRNLGTTLNTYYRLGKSLHLGLIYNQSLLNLDNTPGFIHEYLISLELNWKIPLFTIK